MKNVAIRLDDSKYRKLRVVVVQRGTSLQAAIESLIDKYLTGEEGAPASDAAEKTFRGFLRHSDVMEQRVRERRRELKRDRSRA
jgi:hypothetical protein